MEHPTRFDLNTAVANWRRELAGRLPTATLDEQTGHVRALCATYQQRGLNGEEAFWLACQRVQPVPPPSKSASASSRVWRERVFWMALAVLVVRIWHEVRNLVLQLLIYLCLPAGAMQTMRMLVIYVYQLAWLLLFLWLVIQIARGRLNFNRLATFLFRSRTGFVVFFGGGIFAIQALSLMVSWAGANGAVSRHVLWAIFLANLANLVFGNITILMIAFVAWRFHKRVQNVEESSTIMALPYGSQVPFDLHQALENWRQELAAESGLSSDDQCELEVHLGDVMAGLRSQGLNEEEAFLLARRRVGLPQQLAAEFAKEDPAKVWRERTFWMVLAIFVVGQWMTVWHSLERVWDGHWAPPTSPALGARALGACLVGILSALPILWAAVRLAQGRIRASAQWQFPFRSRWRIAVIGSGCAMATNISWHLASYQNAAGWTPSHMQTFWQSLLLSILLSALFSLPTIGLLTWLWPVQPSKVVASGA